MKIRILITDDSSSLRAVIHRYLADLPDCEFLFAGDGIEAERHLQEGAVLGEDVHLILLDWMMPNFTGYEFLRKIRQTPMFSKDPKIIMLTAETFVSQAEACLKFNVTAYLTKPFTKEELTQVVSQAIAEIRQGSNSGDTGSQDVRHAV